MTVIPVPDPGAGERAAQHCADITDIEPACGERENAPYHGRYTGRCMPVLVTDRDEQ